MFKRVMSVVFNAEKNAARDYESWSKTQLIKRIQELEAGENAPKDEDPQAAKEPSKEPQPKTKPGKTAAAGQKKRKFDFSKHNTRFVAFRFAYMGWNYNGLNFQNEPTPLPTVEEEILQAMTKAKLVPEADPASCNFSRCGRTDKGVSALNQVISLDVRSALSKEEHADKEKDVKELPYLTILNALLPPDIRITAVCLRPPPNFNARFSCKYRHYKYLFKKTDLDVDLMQEAALKYEGPHDFRNFCKIDGSKQITNHCREVYSARIEHFKDDFYVFDLKGTAFLWHQVRCMVAVLFSVGQKLESPSIVDDLLNVSKFPSKPIYEMANDVPLVLYDCVFPEMEWLTSANDFNGTQRPKLAKEHGRFNSLFLEYQLKANIASMVHSVFMPEEIKDNLLQGAGYINLGDGRGRNFKKYVPIAEREMGETVEAVNARHREKKKRKMDNKAEQ
ncbi:hypothetical protein CLUG_04262 [Clavispora lusitaniae ATCC 42720]|uniref:Pseudouridine synthase I TruA alpha/beta domain-containing protein n=1 Tax=Clavispora lusitaniae (strain ATCC 42720) TaxID=306902 RepID=C4Y7T4_CLAL4|nr:uncharacterized protein CLUG_04262 [Clavispora lusitaniae ATCC 42720]EEQ40134.1 hypothetical protein CLUG_04262 [Clavispora lusitaniae ATCC 42720]KAF5209870.1 hypothetical protein E0198_004186 [Clavispora lusitaniae]